MAMLRGDNCTDAVTQRMFRYNPGKTMELFPPKHPYYKAPADAKKEINKLAVIEGRKCAAEYMPLEEELANYENISFGKLKQANKPRKRLLNHCRNSDELDAAVYFWNNPHLLGSPRISILGENKDMTDPKAVQSLFSVGKQRV